LPSLSTPPAPTQISPLSLHDALPILWPAPGAIVPPSFTVVAPTLPLPPNVPPAVTSTGPDNEPSTINVPPATVVLPRNRELSPRSEEHTSELQSRENLVCRLLLEKKK